MEVRMSSPDRIGVVVATIILALVSPALAAGCPTPVTMRDCVGGGGAPGFDASTGARSCFGGRADGCPVDSGAGEPDGREISMVEASRRPARHTVAAVLLIGLLGASAEATDVAQSGLGTAPARPVAVCRLNSDADCAKQFKDTGWSCQNPHLAKYPNGFCECQCLDVGGAKKIDKPRMQDPTGSQNP
jgi:hypothetical protein